MNNDWGRGLIVCSHYFVFIIFEENHGSNQTNFSR